MTDYSHLVADKISMVSRWLERGRPATDEMLLEAVEQLDRTVLGDADRKVVEAVLKRNQGRPPKANVPRLGVAARIEATDHPGLPPPLRDELAHRLRRSKGLTDLQRAMRNHKVMLKRRRDMFIRHLYPEIYALLNDGSVIKHPIIGEIEVPPAIRANPRSTQAAEITANILYRFGFDPPAKGRMMNIISGK